MAFQWFVAYCDPQREAIAHKALTDAAYEAYLPMERYRSRTGPSERPLFSRYLFVGLDPVFQPFAPIRTARGVREILSENLKPRAVPSEMVDELRQAERIGLFDRTPSRLKVGDRVTVEGPFSELIGTIANASNRDRIQVLYDMLGRKVLVQTPLSAVTLAPLANVAAA